MRYIVKEVGKDAEVRTSEMLELETLQGLVGGYIEPVYYGDCIMWVNEEGKLLGLDTNAILAADGRAVDSLNGTIVVDSYDEESEMTDEQIERMLKVLNDSKHYTVAVTDGSMWKVPIIEY